VGVGREGEGVLPGGGEGKFYVRILHDSKKKT